MAAKMRKAVTMSAMMYTIATQPNPIVASLRGPRHSWLLSLTLRVFEGEALE